MDYQKEYNYLQKRYNNLRKEKSRLSLTSKMYQSIYNCNGIDDIVSTLINISLEMHGGKNIIVYYKLGDKWLYKDLFSNSGEADINSSSTLLKTINTCEYQEEYSKFQLGIVDNKLNKVGESNALTSYFPLVVKEKVIGVLKIEERIVWDDRMTEEIILFFKIAAIILNNEIIKTGTIKQAHYEIDQIFESNTDGMAIISTDKNLIRINNTLLSFLNKEKKDVLNKKCYEAINSSHCKQCNIFETLTSDSKSEYDNQIISNANNTISCISTFSPLKDQESNIIGVVENIKDITARKETEEELKQHRDNLESLVKKRTKEIHQVNKKLVETNTELQNANKELEEQKNELEKTLGHLKSTQSKLIHAEKMASLGILTAGIAHEINNPVNYISSGISGLESVISDISLMIEKYDEITRNDIDKPAFDEIRRLKEDFNYEKLTNALPILLKNIKIGTSRTTEIIKSLQTFSRTDKDSKLPSDLIKSMDATLLLLHNKYKDRISIEKKYEFTESILAYPSKLNQVFMNILDNAIDAIFMKPQLTKNESIIIHIYSTKKDTVTIDISDTGIGIPDKILLSIFDPFFTTKEVGKGTGLGLSISAGIIEEHKGSLTATNNKNSGSTFTIVLPKE